MLVVGASTTYGVNNQDNTTWPARLEQELRQRVTYPIEVLNGGVPAGTLNALIDRLSTQWLRYQPDAVIYYEGYKEAPRPYHSVDEAIERFHEGSIPGRLAFKLHYRSMLYTYLVEKWATYRMTQTLTVLPPLKAFRADLQRLIRLVREHGARPVFVLQVMKFPEDPRVRQLTLDREAELRALRLHVAKELKQQPWEERFSRLRVLGAQVFVEAVRREGEAAGIQVIDPRGAFAGRPEAPRLFYDDCHMTDPANAILAREVAARLDVTKGSAP